MAGHSKWANIKHKKAREDAKRGKIFTKIVKKITSAARRGGGDLEANPELRIYVQKAKDANMPNENIERAILKATGQLEGVTYTDFSYEGYGPGGVAFLMDGSTDNKNRTVAEIRHTFTKAGGNLGEPGCVAWMFEDTGIISLSAEEVEDADELMMVALENGALDLEDEDGVFTITTAPTDFAGLRDALVEAGYSEFITDEVTKVSENHLTPDLDTARKNLKLVELLEDYDDIENVYHNLELSDEVAAVLGDED